MTAGRRRRLRMLISRPNDIEFSGERKRVRCNEGLGGVRPTTAKPNGACGCQEESGPEDCIGAEDCKEIGGPGCIGGSEQKMREHESGVRQRGPQDAWEPEKR
jgi:hypothetical protein